MDFSYSIAAASIIAKVLRDKLMVGLARKWDRYGWEHNVGYPTVMHREALRKYGCSPHHRQGYITVRQFSFSMDVEQKSKEKVKDFMSEAVKLNIPLDQILNGECIQVMKTIPSASIDCILPIPI